MAPPIRYVKNGEVNVAYQVVGEGPHDLLMIPGWISHLAMEWEEPTWVRFIARLTRFARLIRFDKRGTGLSDRPPGIPTLEERMEDARAVLDAVGIARTHVLGWSEGGALAVLLAASRPERVESLVLYGTMPCSKKKEDYPWGDDEVEVEEEQRQVEEQWGTDAFAELFGPRGDERYLRWWSAYSRAAASPSAAAALGRANSEIDIRPLLASVRVPTLVVHRQHDRVVPIAGAQYMADRIPGARFVELEGEDHTIWLGDTERLGSEIEHFLTGVRPATREPGSVMAILHADIEGSTSLARELGDERWSDLLAEYARRSEIAVAANDGRVVDRIGDGLMATFHGPVSAIRAAQRLQQDARAAGIAVRAGIHIGEVLEQNGSLRGIAVHIAARVMAHAHGDEVLVSETVRDVVAGSGLTFEDRGVHELKGIEGTRRLFAVA